MSTSSRVTEPDRAAPAMSSCMRLRIRKKVDLPHPDGPIRAVTLPGSIESEIRSRTLFFPNHALTSRATRPAGPPSPEPMSPMDGATPGSPRGIDAVEWDSNGDPSDGLRVHERDQGDRSSEEGFSPEVDPSTRRARPRIVTGSRPRATDIV